MRWRRRYLGLGGGAIGIVVSLACGSAEPTRPATSDTAAARTVEVQPALRRSVERVVRAVGTLLPRENATIAAQVAGQIERLRADLGDRVAAGDELARIDTASYEALARQSAANLARARAAAANAEKNLSRARDLYAEQIASTSELDLAQSESAKAAAEVKSVEAADAIAQLNLTRSRVVAPFGGVVAERLSNVGSYVGIGTPILRLVQADPLRLRLSIPERDAADVRVGQTVRLTVEGDTVLYSGRLVRVSPAVGQTDRSLQVEADVGSGLRPGSFARAEIVVEENVPVVAVPPGALVTFAGIEKVVVVRDGKAVEQGVTTGRHGDGWIEIVSGLDEGVPVVVDPAGLHTGESVVVTPAAAAADR